MHAAEGIKISSFAEAGDAPETLQVLRERRANLLGASMDTFTPDQANLMRKSIIAPQIRNWLKDNGGEIDQNGKVRFPMTGEQGSGMWEGSIVEFAKHIENMGIDIDNDIFNYRRAVLPYEQRRGK